MEALVNPGHSEIKKTANSEELKSDITNLDLYQSQKLESYLEVVSVSSETEPNSQNDVITNKSFDNFSDLASEMPQKFEVFPLDVIKVRFSPDFGLI